MRRFPIGFSAISFAFLLSGCITADQMRRDNFLGQRNGEYVYRIWAYKEYQIKGNGDHVCPHGWRELDRAEGQTDHHYAGPGIVIPRTRIVVTIACPNDAPGKAPV